MITKSRLKQHIEGFPEEFTIEELIERLLLVEKIEKRMQQSEANETISEEELETEMQKWFK